MDKEIILTMQDNKDITVKVNGELKITILNDNRVINANDIYELLNYSSGDSYSVKIINEKSRDVPVIQFFYDLLEDIIKRISQNEGYTGNDFTGNDFTDNDIPF